MGTCHFGMLTVNQVMQVIKESEIDKLVMPWARTKASPLLKVCMVNADSEREATSHHLPFNEVLTLSSSITIKPFGNMVTIRIIGKSLHLPSEGCTQVMTVDMHPEDGKIPMGLLVQNMYTDIDGDG